MDGLFHQKRVLLIENNMEKSQQVESILKNHAIVPLIAPTIHSAISQMMAGTFDVVVLDTNVEDASHLIGLLLDLRHAKNILLLLFPIEASDVRASFLNRGFDMCLPAADPKEYAAVICALLRRPSAHEYPTGATPPGRILYKDLTLPSTCCGERC